ncbi:MAG TPA: hypothetical protein VKR55_25025 [Bradyrhizobium sp.]|uniref:hypothetical protein n=1 Tax=Bradyrhizobium sp. TaxID=376 RepID=UPI002C5E46A3|nr:hypothetical protein [Bradyrhizobium sp.]HLZ05398.1 hypothetical protein [Bradyrhizobium sp.]
MRKLILIAAAMVLASAAAQAGDSRSLSTGLTTNTPSDPPAVVDNQALRADNDTPATTTPSQPDTPRYTAPPTDTPQQAQPAPAPSDTPRYTARPAPVENTPPATATTTPSTTAPSTAHRHASNDEPNYRPSRSRHAHAERAHHRGTYWTAGRIIAELHRYGIDW